MFFTVISISKCIVNVFKLYIIAFFFFTYSFELPIQDMWTGLLHHVTGEHQWGLGGCYHGPLEENSNKELIPKGSTAHRKITELIMDERWSKTIPKYLTFR